MVVICSSQYKHDVKNKFLSELRVLKTYLKRFYKKKNY